MENFEKTPSATTSAKYRFRVLMTEIKSWDIEVEARDEDEALIIADEAPDRDWNIGMSDFETDHVTQLTKRCVCGAVMEWDDLNERWDCPMGRESPTEHKPE